MTYKETTKILDTIALQNKKFEYTNEMLASWHNVFKDYDFNDVFAMTELALSEDRFQSPNSPTAYHLVKNLKKVTEKTKLNSYQVYCPICGRLFDTYLDQVEHFDRCSSIEYVTREFKKWYPDKKQPTKKELYEMSEAEFKVRYMKLLARIYKNTTNPREKENVGLVLGVNEK